MKISRRPGTAGRLRSRGWQAAAWIVLIGTLWTLDTLTKLHDREQTGVGPDNFRLFTEQATSAAGVLVMILFLVWWLDHFPIRITRLPATVASLVLGSVIFAVGHYAILFGLRRLIYALADVDAVMPASLWSNLAVEYQKDVKIFIGIVVIILLYRAYLGQPRHRQPATPGSTRLLVQTASGETVLNYDQIDYLESARNYVSVYSAGREYLTRSTMVGLLEQLADARFVRTHRSFAVNLDKVVEIRAVDSAYVVRMADGTEVPLSRQYRDALRQRIAGRDADTTAASA